MRLLVVSGIRDTQCGFKLFHRDVAREVFSRTTVDRFAFDVEALLLARRLGYRIAEVPVLWFNSPDTRVGLGERAGGLRRPLPDPLARLPDDARAAGSSTGLTRGPPGFGVPGLPLPVLLPIRSPVETGGAP